MSGATDSPGFVSVPWRRKPAFPTPLFHLLLPAHQATLEMAGWVPDGEGVPQEQGRGGGVPGDQRTGGRPRGSFQAV